MQLTKVWVIQSGLKGYSADGRQIDLMPGIPGWMDRPDAEAADKKGQVQIMAGLRPQDLKDPQKSTPKSRSGGKSKRQYDRKDMTAKRPGDNETTVT